MRLKPFRVVRVKTPITTPLKGTVIRVIETKITTDLVILKMIIEVATLQIVEVSAHVMMFPV